MQASWELDDATHVVATLASSGWTVHVNGTKVDATTKRLGLLSNQADFKLAHDRPASISMRPSWSDGRPEIDLNVDGKSLLFSGKRPLRCPNCKCDTQPRHTHCTRCGSVQPTRAQRIQERRVRALSSTIFGLGLGYPIVTLPFLIRGFFSSSSTSADTAKLNAVLLSSAVLVAVAFGLAALSKKAPLMAAGLNAGFWAFVTLLSLRAPSRSWMLLFFEAMFAFYCYRAIKLALEIRKHAAQQVTSTLSSQ